MIEYFLIVVYSPIKNFDLH